MDSPSYQYQYNSILRKCHLWNRKEEGRCHCALSSVLIFHRALAIKAGNMSVGGRLQLDWEWLHKLFPKKVFYFHCKSKKDFQWINSEETNIRLFPIREGPKNFLFGKNISSHGKLLAFLWLEGTIWWHYSHQVIISHLTQANNKIFSSL